VGAGSEGNANVDAVHAVNAFISDLTAADAIDISALRTGEDGTGAIEELPVGQLASGDYRVPLSGLFLAGLEQVTSGSASGEPAPVDKLSAGSFLTVALASPADISAATERVVAVPTMQELAEQMLPQLYVPLDGFAAQIYA